MWTLREASGADYDGFYHLDQQCFPPGIAYSRADFRAFLSQPHSIALLAEGASGALLGFILAGQRRRGELHYGYVVTIDVAESARRQGVGRALLFAVEKHLREEGLASIRLEVAVDNFAAQQFYEREHYRPIGRIPRYYMDKIDALVLEKSLL
jgi:ribosomal-protein-alanine N-acetyltransferase